MVPGAPFLPRWLLSRMHNNNCFLDVPPTRTMPPLVHAVREHCQPRKLNLQPSSTDGAGIHPNNDEDNSPMPGKATP